MMCLNVGLLESAKFSLSPVKLCIMSDDVKREGVKVSWIHVVEDRIV
jgi:hypothetical protein